MAEMDNAVTVLRFADMQQSRKQRKRFSENRWFTTEPLPPPPPPPPQDSPEGPLFAFFRLSSSQPNLSELGYEVNSSSTRKPDESKPIASESNAYIVAGTRTGERTLHNQSHARNFDNPLVSRELQEEKGKLSPVVRGVTQKQIQNLSCAIVPTQNRGDDKILVNSSKLESTDFYFRQKVQSSFRTPPARTNNPVLEESFEFALTPVQKRPTSLFRPGQVATFFEDYRFSIPQPKHSKAQLGCKRLSERNMTGNAHVTNHYQRKRRPLPPIPQGSVHSRDVGVMTPDEMFDIHAGDAHGKDSATTPSFCSSVNSLTGKPFGSRSRRRATSKCKIFLLVIPSLIALISSTLLVLFMLGVFGTSETKYKEDYTVSPAPGKTTNVPKIEKAKRPEDSEHNGDNTEMPEIDTSQHDTKTPQPPNRTDPTVTLVVSIGDVVNVTFTNTDQTTTKIKKRNKKKIKKTPGPSNATLQPSVTSQADVRTNKKKGSPNRSQKRRKRRKKMRIETRTDIRKQQRLTEDRSGSDSSRSRQGDVITPSSAKKEPKIYQKIAKSNTGTSSEIAVGDLESGAAKTISEQGHESVYEEFGSGGGDRKTFVSDDEDWESEEEKSKETNFCLPILDQVCDAVLPYRLTFQNSPKEDLTRSVLISLLTEVLRNHSATCDGESDSIARPEYPCKTWCRSIMTSCLDDESLSVVLALQHGDVALDDVGTNSIKQLSEKLRRTRRYNLVQTEKRPEPNAYLISYLCKVLLNEDVTNTSSHQCVDLSTMDQFMQSQVVTNESLASACGDGGFHCPGGGCLDSRWLCDGINDCGAMEDEKNCVCLYNEFKCSSGQCVEQPKRCDGFYDCVDRSDEKNCDCNGVLKSCGGGQCVLADWWCDGDPDCINGVDEIHCDCASKGMKSCNNTCIPTRFVCDGEEDCEGGSDEINCQYKLHQRITSAFKCGPWEILCDDNCVSVTKQCDGRVDCMDGSDEVGCGSCETVILEVCQPTHFNITNIPNFFGHLSQSESIMGIDYVVFTSGVHTRCHPLLSNLGCSLFVPPASGCCGNCNSSSNHVTNDRVLPCRSFCEEVRAACSPVMRSVTLSWPKYLDCNHFPVRSASIPCYDPRSMPGEGFCAANQILCNSTQSTTTRCISVTSRCDGINHCEDGSDESECDCNGLGRFQCKSTNSCILSSWVCDSHKDCPDSSDEVNCDRCNASQKSCTDHTCIASNTWCDGKEDCSDGSDETNCLLLVSRQQWRLRHGNLGEAPLGRSGGLLIGYSRFTSQWHPICADSWNGAVSHLACSQLGFSEALSYSPTHLRRRSRHGSMMISNNRRIRTVQETFSGKRTACKHRTYVHIKCKPKQCGKRRDVTSKGVKVPRILGGRISRDNEWPWLASLTLPGMVHVCGATLVHLNWLISAAHCFQERMNVKIWQARMDTTGRNSLHLSTVFNVTKIVIHPRYHSQAVDFDIALVKLSQRVPISMPLCLPTYKFHAGSFCIIAGWGISSRTQKGAQKLHEGSVHVIERTTCQRYYPNHVITNRMICAGKVGIVDACSGDSGGPLMCWHPQTQRWQLAGITSWGSSCKPHSAPGVYTDVSYFNKWTERTIGLEAYG